MNRSSALKVIVGVGLATLMLLLAFLPRSLKADQVQPLHGGIFVGDLTVPEDGFSTGEPLSLDEVTRLALAENLDMRIARLTRESKHHDRSIAMAIYDTEIAMAGTYLHDEAKQSNSVFGNREIDGDVSISVSKEIPLGTNLGVDLISERHSTASTFSSLSRNYESLAKFTVKQPLLKNFFGWIDRAELRQVRLDIKQFDYDTLDEIEATLAEIRSQYWDLKFAHENLLTRRKALRKAQNFLSITREKLDIGLTEKPDVYAAEANVRQRVLDVLEATHTLFSASYALKVNLRMPEVELILPADAPVFEPLDIDYSEALDLALESRLDLKKKELEIENQETEVKIRKQEKWPDLDFEGSLGSQALERELGPSQTKVFDWENLQYYAAFKLSSPLENREARHAATQAELELQKVKREREKLRMIVGMEIDESWRNLQLTANRVRQTREIERLQRQKLEEEEKNFNRGRSDSKAIIDFQEDVIDAETEAISGLVDYMKAVDGYYRSANRLLEYADVSKEHL
ncbi:MAG: TolC family protein [Candidatus Omnitrophota bacterium]|nr:TolC family protein [Candidatus Omnitrophota bacterium]